MKQSKMGASRTQKSVSFAEARGPLSLSEMIVEAKVCFILFFFSVSIYTYFFIPMERQNLLGMILKCLPIVSLQIFLLMKISYGSGSNGDFQQKILAGLVFSSVGDALLDFPGYFLHGTIAFAFAQMCYIWAFGFSPLKPKVGLLLLGVMSLPILCITTNLMKEEFKLLVTVSMYAPLLKVMVWRAVSRIDCCDQTSKVRTDWSKIFGGLGAISFGLSDAALGLNRYSQPIPYAQAIIMGTYYLAQLGITLSAVDRPASAKVRKSN